MMPFEAGSNAMHGKFTFKSLDKRIRAIRSAIDAETESWIKDGKRAFEARDRVAENLQFQFAQCQQAMNSSAGGNTLTTVTFEMEKDNPFLWTLVSNHLSAQPNHSQAFGFLSSYLSVMWWLANLYVG